MKQLRKLSWKEIVGAFAIGALFLAALPLGVIPFAIFITYTTTLPFLPQLYIVGVLVVVWLLAYAQLKQYARRISRAHQKAGI